MPNARKIALNVIQKIFDGGYSNLVMKEVLSSNDISNTDKSFINNLVLGVVERRLTLDYIIENASNRPIKKISTEALFPLRMGVYQILYMDKVPDSAAVNESVKLVKASKKPFLSGFVNGVLRGVLRAEDRYLPRECRTEKDLSVIYSCGEDIVCRLVKQYGFDITENILKTSFKIPPTVVKVNNLKISDEDFAALMSSLSVCATKADLPRMFFVKGLADISSNEAYKKGCFHIQDLSSASTAFFVGCKPGERIFDVCAAPGGKTFTMAEIMGDRGEIIAGDKHPHRVKLIDDGRKRLGLSSIKPVVSDALSFDEKLGEFDRVLCDVPCSGIGVIARKPEIKYKNSDDFCSLPDVQFEILKNASRYLKKGGTLVYSTCTLFKEENEQVIEKFLRYAPSFTLDSQKTVIPDENHDGFFMARLINTSL